MPGHVLVAVTLTSDAEISLAPLSYDWFNKGLSQRTLPAPLKASRGERDQVVLGGDRVPLLAVARHGQQEPERAGLRRGDGVPEINPRAKTETNPGTKTRRPRGKRR